MVENSQIKLAFNASTLGSADFQTIVDLAKRCSFDGVELFATRDPGNGSAYNALLTDPEKIRRVFSAADIHISSLAMGNDLDELEPRIELAAQLDCHCLKMNPDLLLDRGGTVLPGLVERLISAGDLAARRGITLLIQNQPVAGSALRLWHLLDRLKHPCIGCCWNTLFAARAGDAPSVAIPLLNSRVRFVDLQDAKQDGNSWTPCDVGQGSVPLRKTLNRLRGLGFSGYLCAVFPSSPDRDITDFDQQLKATHTLLQSWKILPIPIGI